MRILAVNSGSSTLKLSLVDERGLVVDAVALPAIHGQADASALALALSSPALGGAHAVAHRIVDGRTHLTDAVVMGDGIDAELRHLSDGAPPHQRSGLSTMATVTTLLPHLPCVACFDGAFHSTIPDHAATYALPQAWRQRWDLRRRGAFGIAHAAVARQFPDGRVVSCHLGDSTSLCALSDGTSVDATMGLTPMAGLVMARRPGDVDPGLLLWLLHETELTVEDVAAGLERDSGLRGLTGTADMRAVLAGAEAGDERCILGLAVYAHRLSAGIAAMTASLGGIDALVFSGGVGQHAPPIRAEAASRLGFLGILLDIAANAAAVGDARISASESAASVHVSTGREDVEMARQARAALA